MCSRCGEVIGKYCQLYDYICAQIQQNPKYDQIGDVFKILGITKMCCKTDLMTKIDINKLYYGYPQLGSQYK